MSGPLGLELTQAVKEAIGTAPSMTRWQQLRRLSPSDPFGAALDESVRARLFDAGPGGNFGSWFRGVEAWLIDVADPRRSISTEDGLLNDLWTSFAEGLQLGLRRLRTEADIPRTGGVFAFVAGLSQCLVIRYAFSGTSATLSPVAVIDHPKSAFDLWWVAQREDSVVRNTLKGILASGHKLVAHRGVLVHVDRRQDADVFGPSIDTLLMAEILAQDLYERRALASLRNTTDAPSISTALEIGSGSGLLSAGIIQHLPGLKELWSFDIAFAAVSCTEKNVRVARASPGAAGRCTVNLVSGAFAGSEVNRHFDLIVCNPPYIPTPPDTRYSPTALPDHLGAVGGLTLLQQVVSAAPTMLTAHGRLLLMTSSVTPPDITSTLPSGFVVERPFGTAGYRVCFDVEAVFERPGWMEYLQQCGGITREGNDYFHDLHPLWIRRQ